MDRRTNAVGNSKDSPAEDKANGDRQDMKFAHRRKRDVEWRKISESFSAAPPVSGVLSPTGHGGSFTCFQSVLTSHWLNIASGRQRVSDCKDAPSATAAGAKTGGSFSASLATLLCCAGCGSQPAQRTVDRAHRDHHDSEAGFCRD